MSKYLGQSILHKILAGLAGNVSKQSRILVSQLQRQPSNDHDAWHIYWQAHDQLWRTEPEIDVQRQRELAQCRAIVPDPEKGLYPYKGMKLNRADVEWLLATHESNGIRGPIDWSDESQRKREGLDLRGADLRSNDGQFNDFSNLPLARLCGGVIVDELTDATVAQLTSSRVQMQGIILRGSQLEGAILNAAELEDADLWEAQMEGAILNWAQLEGAILCKADLCGTQLKQTNLCRAQLKQANLSWAQMEETSFKDAQLEGASFVSAQLKSVNFRRAQMENVTFFTAQLQGVDLCEAQLKGARFIMANLKGADLSNAYLKGANLSLAKLEGANLSNAYLEGAILDRIILANEKGIGPQLADVQWGRTNITVVDWSQIKILGEDYEARQKKNSDDRPSSSRPKSKKAYLNTAVRANRQLAVALRDHGLNEDAARFAYRAQILQRISFRIQMIQGEAKFRQRMRMLGAWLFSWFLSLLSGYGYRPLRTLGWYIGVIIVCSFFYLLGETHGIFYACQPSLESSYFHIFTDCYWNWGTILPAIFDALATSVTALHGRGLFSMSFEPGNWRIYLAAAEAVFGLFIEASFIATFTQRYFGK